MRSANFSHKLSGFLMRRQFFPFTLAISLLAMPTMRIAADEPPVAAPTPIELHQEKFARPSAQSPGTPTVLPFVLLFDAQGRLVGQHSGYRSDIMAIWHKAIVKRAPSPKQSTITLRGVLAEATRSDGTGLPVTLPQADYYLVDYWAEWCAYCRRFDRDLRRDLAAWGAPSVVWLRIETAPDPS